MLSTYRDNNVKCDFPEKAHTVNIKSQIMKKLHCFTSIQGKKSGITTVTGCPTPEGQISL
jgi:predicted XRE-type DNA-binding protein